MVKQLELMVDGQVTKYNFLNKIYMRSNIVLSNK